jgi:hypothetical protein
LLLWNATTLEEDEVRSGGMGERKEDKGSPNGGGEELVIVYGLTRLHVGNSLGSLTRNARRRWIYPSFEPPPLRICNQEEITTNSEAIGVGEIVKEDRSEEMSEEEGEVNATSPRGISLERSLTTKNQIA